MIEKVYKFLYNHCQTALRTSRDVPHKQALTTSCPSQIWGPSSLPIHTSICGIHNPQPAWQDAQGVKSHGFPALRGACHRRSFPTDAQSKSLSDLVGSEKRDNEAKRKRRKGKWKENEKEEGKKKKEENERK